MFLDVEIVEQKLCQLPQIAYVKMDITLILMNKQIKFVSNVQLDAKLVIIVRHKYKIFY